MNQIILDNALNLVKSSKIALIGTVDGKDYPNIKAMFNLENEGLNKFWFSTNTSSKRVAQVKNNPKACIYFMDPNDFNGLMLVGEIQVLEDIESKKRLWRPGFEMYYPLGINDPDYCVLNFTAQRGNYYHNLSNTNFELGEGS